MKTILNLTQHAASAEQVAAGVVDLTGEIRAAAITALNFLQLPQLEEIQDRARVLAEIAAQSGATAAMIGGAPYLMGALEGALAERGITPLYAFSVRESVEETLPDGSTRKTAVFRHVGFVATR